MHPVLSKLLNTGVSVYPVRLVHKETLAVRAQLNLGLSENENSRGLQQTRYLNEFQYPL